eukprot:7016197-Prymnesium_polylepis.1
MRPTSLPVPPRTGYRRSTLFPYSNPIAPGDCYMLLPNGSKIKFTETDIGYFLPFYPDFDATHLQAHEYYVPKTRIHRRCTVGAPWKAVP